jgi:hypothetical protein
MVIALSVLLAAVALLLVAWPLVRGSAARDESQAAAGQEALSDLVAQRDGTLQAIRELQFDRDVGKLTADDFLVFERNLKMAAAESLRRLDAWEAAADREIAAAVPARAAKTPAPSRGATADGSSCPRCGSAIAADDVFCTRCGSDLTSPTPGKAEPDSRFCRKCGRRREAEDLFCPGCGARL